MTEKERILEKRFPITGEKLVEIFTSRKFLRALRQIEKRVRESDIEDGLQVFMSLGSGDFEIKRFLRPIEPGRLVLTEETEKEREGLRKKGKFPIIEIHFHAEAFADFNWRGYLPIDFVPSGADLESLMETRGFARLEGFDIKSINGVGLGMGSGNVRLLLFQESHEPISVLELKEYEKETKHITTPAELLGILRDYGYKGEIIEVQANKISPQDQEKIRSFSFDIQRWEEKNEL